MNTFKRKKRYNFMNYVLIILFSILSFQLFYLTVVKGNYYRNIVNKLSIFSFKFSSDNSFSSEKKIVT